MEAQAYLWHYVIAALLLAGLGGLGHVTRGVFNVFPDRLSDKPLMDMMISDGYDLNDWLFGTEYDDYGFYRLDSLKNLRIAVWSTVIIGLAVLLIVPHASSLMAYGINQSFVWLWDLFVYRLSEVGL